MFCCETWASHLAPSADQGLPVTPLTPLKIGHLASILAAGFLDGNVLEDGDERLLIKGHAYKKLVMREKEEKQPDGKIKKSNTATEVLETNITTIKPDGTITPITGNDLEKFLMRWTTQLTEIIANKYPPAYRFDYQGGAPLYQYDRRRSKKQQPGSFAKYMQREKVILQGEILPAPKNDGYARWPLARYIRATYSGKIDLLIADEGHQFKSASSDQGMAFADLVVASKKTLGMTGTIFGGKALSLFFMPPHGAP